jgi:hypothetical protein
MLKVILVGTLSHYETRGMIDDKRLEHMLSAGKQILYKSHQESEVRWVLEFCILCVIGLIYYMANLLLGIDSVWGCRPQYGRDLLTC